MQSPIPRYLNAVKAEIASTLWPEADVHGQQVALYSQRLLTQVTIQMQILPDLQARSLAAYAEQLHCFEALLATDEAGRLLVNDIRRHVSEAPNYAKAEAAIQAAVARLHPGATTEARLLLRRISVIELDLWRAVKAATRAGELRPRRPEVAAEVFSDHQKRQLRDFLRARFPSDGALELGPLKRIAGGFSKQTVFVELRNTVELPGMVVLRSDRPDSPVGSTVSDEFGIIKTLFDAGVPVPRPFALQNEPALLGVPFLIVGKLEGNNAGDAHDVSMPTRDFGVSLAQGLARLHAIPPGRFGTKIAGSGTTTRDRMSDEIQKFESRWRALNIASVSLEIAFAWLKQHIEFAAGARSLVHQDIGCHNMLVKDGRLSGLLDWETAAIGNPAQDLGYAYHTVVQLMPWQDFLAEYERAGGVATIPEQIDFYRLWRCVWVTPLVMQATAFFESQESGAISLAYGGLFNLQKLNISLRETLDELLKIS